MFFDFSFDFSFDPRPYMPLFYLSQILAFGSAIAAIVQYAKEKQEERLTEKKNVVSSRNG